MNERQNKIVRFLWNFNSLKEEQIMKLCECTENDINELIGKKIIVKDKEKKILRYVLKEVNERNVVAFDVVMEYLDRNPKILKAQYPVNVTMKIGYCCYDIIYVKEDEIEKLFKDIDKISKADKIIIIIETNNYIERKIHTKRPCYICTSPPLEIVDEIN